MTPNQTILAIADLSAREAKQALKYQKRRLPFRWEEPAMLLIVAVAFFALGVVWGRA
jgi:hypothetical protein